MKLDDLLRMAREAGERGLSFDDFIEDDAIGDAYVALDEQDMLDRSATEKIETAFREAEAKYRATHGWAIGWTTAPTSYDQFKTTTLESFDWDGRTLRKVVMNPDHADAQMARYAGGAPVWLEDPRIAEARTAEKFAREKAEDEEKARVREEGLTWIRTADLAYTDEDIFDQELRRRGLQWTDLRVEEERRREERDSAVAAEC